MIFTQKFFFLQEIWMMSAFEILIGQQVDVSQEPKKLSQGILGACGHAYSHQSLRYFIFMKWKLVIFIQKFFFLQEIWMMSVFEILIGQQVDVSQEPKKLS